MKESKCPSCGKKFLFDSKEEAEAFLLTERAKRLGLVRSYKCNGGTSFYHVTKTTFFSVKGNPRTQQSFALLELELRREMATLKQWVIEYMATAYKEKGVVEFTSSEIKDAYAKAFPKKPIDSIYGTIGFLKKDGIIVDLNKRVPGTSKGSFFTLTKIIEKETNPVSKRPTPVNVPAQPTVKEEPKKASPVTVAANPFDKVNTTLAELLAKVNGLIQGYSELVQKTPNVDVTVDFSEIKEMLSKHESASYQRHVALFENLGKKQPSVHSVEIGGAAVIAEEVNRRLRDTTQEDTLLNDIYHIMSINTSDIISKVAIPEGVSNQDDYRAGLKEGIRLATEMNLAIRQD